MKKEVDIVDATPSKRLFRSIIADYNINTAICELIDNALDIWIQNDRKSKVQIDIDLNEEQQTIQVIDNAGGVPKDHLNCIVGPGQTTNEPESDTIGIFGVGTKRAVVALSQEIKIITRFKNGNTYQVEFDDNWLKIEEWELPVFQVDLISENTTIIELNKLRNKIDGKVINGLGYHLEETYAFFLKNKKVKIYLNGILVKPRYFTNWAYPPKYEPRAYYSKISYKDISPVDLKIVGGLTKESSPAGGEYGVYFYCNDRLIAKEIKNFHVGFIKGLAGLPHPNISITRVIVFLNGEAKSMPWNSSKSNIDYNHKIFKSIHDLLVQIVKEYASISRRWQGDWPNNVFKHKKGKIKKVKIKDISTAKKSYLPPLPKTRKKFEDIVAQQNREIVHEKPWTKGLYEGIIATDIISKKKLDQKNRINLIILDSTLEIAFKEYLVNDTEHHYSDTDLKRIFSKRHLVHREIKNYIRIAIKDWRKIKHYYNLRCKLIHERATVGLTDDDINNFRELVEKILKRLFKLKFGGR